MKAQWFRITPPSSIRDPEASFMLLVVNGRVATSNSILPVGKAWVLVADEWRSWGWQIKEVPEVGT